MREITGRHVLVFTVGAFGIIIAVNLLMAYKAISTFPGLEVQNSYVASQQFDARRDAQKALGWTMEHSYDPQTDHLSIAFVTKEGHAAPVAAMTVLVGRTTAAEDDQTPEFLYLNGRWETRVALEPGKWLLRVTAKADDGTLFDQRVSLFVRG